MEIRRAISYAKKRADELGLEYENIIASPKKDKKLRIILPDDSYVDFGLKSSQTFAEGASEKKRDMYRARASKIVNKNGEYTYKIPYTANYLSYHLLW